MKRWSAGRSPKKRPSSSSCHKFFRWRAKVMMSVPVFFQEDDEKAAPLFLFFAVMNVLAFLYVYAFCPETAKKTLEEMIEVFGGNVSK